MAMRRAEAEVALYILDTICWLPELNCTCFYHATLFYFQPTLQPYQMGL